MAMKRRLPWPAALVALAAAVAAGGLFLAARSGWTPPSWLSFLSPAAPAAEDAGLFCGEHGVPEKFCTLCHAELSGHLAQCTEHGLPEAICTLCNPGNIGKYGITGLCREHGLPAPFCSRCNPALPGGELKGDWCPRHLVPQPLCTRCAPELRDSIAMCPHDIPQALCTLCRPELKESVPACKPHGLPLGYCEDAGCRQALAAAALQFKPGLPVVRLAGPEIAGEAGIETTAASPGRVVPVVRAAGEVAYDETRLARVRSRAAGVLVELAAKEGDVVAAGQTLAVVDAAELGEAKAEYLAALPLVELWSRTLERQRTLMDRGAGAAKDVLAAEAELGRARAEQGKAEQRLRSYGLDGGQLERLAEEPEEERNRWRVISPLGGTVVRRRGVAGEAIEPAAELFVVVDLTRMWVHLQAQEEDLRRFKVGQDMTFEVPALPGEALRGKVVWIDAEVDDQTRTVRVRCEVGNPHGLLRANMFGEGEVQVDEARTSLLVPRAALQWEGASYVVFVKKAADRFEPRRVLAGEDRGGLTELAWTDIQPGEPVVTTGSFLLKTEIQKGSIGAGCCGE